MRDIETAVVPVAGYGTRRLPETISQEKCMLGIAGRAAVDYVVEDCAKAGLKRVIFVVGEQSEQVRRQYGGNKQLERYLERQGKRDELKMVRSTRRGMAVEFVTQSDGGRYGTAVPLYLAREELKNEAAFAVLMGDDFVYRRDGGSEVADLIDSWQASEAPHAMMSHRIPEAEVSKYGVLDVRQGLLHGVVEKPEPAEAPSNLINISKYIFSASILGHLATYMAGSPAANGEWQLTDVLSTTVNAGEGIAVHDIQGEYIDAGSVEGAAIGWEIIMADMKAKQPQP